MPAPGIEASVAIKIQTGLGVPAATPYGQVWHDDFDYGPGRIKNTNRPRIGGSLSPKFAGIVLGNRPFAGGRCPLDLNTLGILLQLAGRVESGISPTFTYNEATSATFKYGSLDVKPIISGLQVGYRDFRLRRLVINVPAGNEPTLEYAGPCTNVADSVVVHTAAAAPKQPSPAETIVAANSTIFGTTGFTVLSFRYQIDLTIDNNRQPIGSNTPDDTRVIMFMTSAVIAIDVTATNWKRLFYGNSAGTALATTIATGALKFRPTVPGGTSYVDFDWSAAEYELDEAARIRAEEEGILVVRAFPRAAPVETISLA